MSLVPRFTYGAIDLTDYPYSVEWGANFGAPETVYAAAASLVSDGEIVTAVRDGNRRLEVPVLVEGSDMFELGANCEALVAELRKPRNSLTIEPGDGLDAATIVFDTFAGELLWNRDDDAEQAYIRRGVLRLPAHPHARSATLTQTVLTAVSGAGTLTIPVGGSVRTTGSVSISRPSNVLTGVMLYADPEMLTTGFSPSNSATWAAAPAGRYLIYVYRENVIGSVGPGEDIATDDVVVVTVTAGGKTQSVRTRAIAGADWIPVGEVDLGGMRDGTIGAISLDGTKNGTTMTTEVYRMFRMDSDTSLIYTQIPSSRSVNEIIIDTPSVDFPQGGVWFDGVDGLDLVDAWDFPVLVPPQTALWVSLDGAFNAAVTVTHYERWHTFSASEAS